MTKRMQNHIKELEEALGVRLIERTSRSMALTSAGLALLDEAEGAIGIWRRGSSNARSFADGPVGNLVVTAPDVVSERFVVPAIARLVAQHSSVQVELRVSTANLDLLAEGVDVAVRVGPLQDSGYGVRTLHRSQHGIVATPQLAAAWPAAHPRDLDAAPWVDFGRHPDQIDLRDPDGRSHRLPSRNRTRSTSAGAFIGLIVAGAGFGLVPRVLVEPELRDGRLVEMLPEWSRGPATFYALTPSPRATDVKVRLFMDLLAELFEGSESEPA